MFHGIRKRLVGTYLIVITLTVLLIEAIVISSINFYYINNVRNFISIQASTISNYYQNYLSNTDIQYNAGKIINGFSHLPFQIQITDTNGLVFGDSLHQTFGEVLRNQDIIDVANGKATYFSGKDPITDERILSYSAPLVSSSKTVGIVKLTTSLETTYKAIHDLTFLAALAGLIIVIFVFLISIYISNTIINPIKKLTEISLEIAKGNYKIRAEKISNDEIGILAQSINHMTQEIQKNEELKNEFITSISHELRTPLTSIKGWAVTMQNSNSQDKDILERGIHIINIEVDRLSEMVEELLDFSRLQAGKFSLNFENTDLNKLILDICYQMSQRAERQNIRLEINIENKPIQMDVDPKRIKQVLINLLDNSLKFTPNGGAITVTSKVILLNQNTYYEIAIADTGLGIYQEDIPLITNRFFRGRNTNDKNGIGLGLSISSELLKSHGGSLEIQSTVGKGTKVTLKLPLITL